MIMQPQSPPKPTLRSWLTTEWDHLVDLPTPTLVQLGVFSIILIWFNPLLPFAGYGLQLWAAQSWQWPSRWASIRAAARQGGWFVAWLCILAVLADAHIWFFPTLANLAQTLWHAVHLPGDLGIVPFKNDLVARCVLLLPLAPVAARLYERINPRTQIDPRRRLLPADLVKPTGAPPAQQQSPPPPAALSSAPEEVKKQDQTTTASSAQESKPAAPEEQKKRQPRSTQTTRQKPPHEPEAEQLTIDSFLATSPDQAQQDQQPPKTSGTRSTGSSKTPGARKKKQAATPTNTSTTEETPSPPPATQKQPEVINWDDVAE